MPDSSVAFWTSTGKLKRVIVTAAALFALLLLSQIWRPAENSGLAQLVKWMPYLLKGFALNIWISILAIALGTLTGLIVGAMAHSDWRWLNAPARLFIHVFRNAPLLVLIFFTTYLFPFELKIGDVYVPFPDWIKVMLGLALPACANVAEIFRGAIRSIPAAQWETALSLAFSRVQALRWLILPQCFKRMLPPWMNLYAHIAMGTTMASLVGVGDVLESARNAASTVNQISFTMLVYLAVLLLFFAYCYPIARFTQRLERRFGFSQTQ
ncbi:MULTISPECIES: amino acid ABC transporter permease [unclassified Brenneria]|uniref:amino acid ABC transporter permease n=1 Tax=unclassified Brenneria TaxID=2634434 RepID=UPI0018F0C40F|nr:amino acid ABC transporter permease [Brenneria sp. L3-3C-1]MBJ7220293.1 amino acid ABC transporter permease [Brenneria sp. L3-3C-1]MEE3641538.1 amino acid ABC transporter permease [Brenneria sp. L3_3C_1]